MAMSNYVLQAKNERVWTKWVNDWNNLYTHSTTSATTNNRIWTGWASTTTATTNTYTTNVDTWRVWIDEEFERTRHIRTGRIVQPEAPAIVYARSAEDVERERKAWEEQCKKERELRIAAEKRAEALLLSILSTREQERYKKEQAIVVIGKSGTPYQIRKGRTGNVDVLSKDGKVQHALCAHPIERVPDCDTMVAQKLLLEHDDAAFARGANIHGAYERQGQQVVLH